MGGDPHYIENLHRGFHFSRGPSVAILGRIMLRRERQEVLLPAALILAKQFPYAEFLLVNPPFAGHEEHRRGLERLRESRGLRGRVVFTRELADPWVVDAATNVTMRASYLAEPRGGFFRGSHDDGEACVGQAAGRGTREDRRGDNRSSCRAEISGSHGAGHGTAYGAFKIPIRDGPGARVRFQAHFEQVIFYTRATELYAEVRLHW